jgi:hypothetical protein
LLNGVMDEKCDDDDIVVIEERHYKCTTIFLCKQRHCKRLPHVLFEKQAHG